mmetsp:Transcript_65458/g.182181  ORF Transcript_65458/g.182181 Transcript_65458/m.182181 type:complete len:199 (-) Transcript_65458:140-736(-)
MAAIAASTAGVGLWVGCHHLRRGACVHRRRVCPRGLCLPLFALLLSLANSQGRPFLRPRPPCGVATLARLSGTVVHASGHGGARRESSALGPRENVGEAAAAAPATAGQPLIPAEERAPSAAAGTRAAVVDEGPDEAGDRVDWFVPGVVALWAVGFSAIYGAEWVSGGLGDSGGKIAVAFCLFLLAIVFAAVVKETLL